MATIDQVYRDNLKLLIGAAPATPKCRAGTVAAFAEQVGKSASQVSQWLNSSKDSKTGKPRRLSADMARVIEAKCARPVGWMDVPHDDRPAFELKAQEPPAAYGADPDGPALPGEHFDALAPDEQRLLDNFRELADEDEKQSILEDLSTKAAKARALREHIEQEVLAKYGVKPTPVRHAADEKKTAVARAALAVTKNLRQRSLFEPKK